MEALKRVKISLVNMSGAALNIYNTALQSTLVLPTKFIARSPLAPVLLFIFLVGLPDPSLTVSESSSLACCKMRSAKLHEATMPLKTRLPSISSCSFCVNLY